jgi:PhnB protein
MGGLFGIVDALAGLLPTVALGYGVSIRHKTLLRILLSVLRYDSICVGNKAFSGRQPLRQVVNCKGLPSVDNGELKLSKSGFQTMNASHIYLTFDGNCRKAMTFYGKCLGGEPNFTTFAEGPPEVAATAKDAANRILHAELHNGPMVMMASDTMPGMPFTQGTNFSISITCDTLAEMESLFAVIGEGGAVTMPMHDAFWGGRFGMLTDQFGIQWMLSFREPGQHS